METNPYIEQGYKNRLDYLTCLANEHGIPLNRVLSLANALGPEEDFDFLVSTLEDMQEGSNNGEI